MKFSIKDFFSKCDKIRNFLRIWSHLLKKSYMENFIFMQWLFYKDFYESDKFQSSFGGFSSDLCSDKLVGKPGQSKYFVYEEDKRHFYACIRNSGDTATINIGCLRCPETLIYSPSCRQCLTRLDGM